MPRKPKILVTSAAGNTGLPLALQLCAQGIPVRALVRRDDARAVRLRAAGAEVMIGDQYAIGTMRRAMDGVQRAYHCAPSAPNGLHFGSAFTAAAAEARLEHIVMISQWLAQPNHPSILTRETYLNEMAVRALPDTSFTILNPGWFASNYFFVLAPAAHLGVLPMPLGDGDEKKNAAPTNEAIAAVAAACLSDAAEHIAKTYRPTGPEMLSPNQIAEAFGQGLGRRVRYLPVSEKMMAKALTAHKPRNYSALMMSQLALYTREYRQGAFAVGGATQIVQSIGGQKPETMAQSVARAMRETPALTQSFGRTAREVWGMLRTAATRPPNMRKNLRQSMVGQPDPATLSIDNPH